LSHFKLSSNVIVPLHGITKDPESGDFMLIIEYMPGGDLNHFLKNKNIILTWMECYSLLISIAAALLTIYRNGLVHKDLHPGNILTHEHHWRISDLGLCGPANACKDDEYSNRTIAGVMPYVAPEVLKYKIYTYAADIYNEEYTELDGTFVVPTEPGEECRSKEITILKENHDTNMECKNFFLFHFVTVFKNY